ncbi:hypothetical protein [Halopelagius fulvigenes]|uniref:Uncharacterized protein n=1 Tax=Halopelagius fulvigenes TaxID=1198324 RepID=A0ABD5U2A8_9EURY
MDDEADAPPPDQRSIEDAEETDRYQELLMQAVSKKLNTAVESGNLSVMSHATGVTSGNSSIEMADWNKYEQLKDLFRQEPQYNTEFTNNIFQCIIFSSRVPPYGAWEVEHNVHPRRDRADSLPRSPGTIE